MTSAKPSFASIKQSLAWGKPPFPSGGRLGAGALGLRELESDVPSRADAHQRQHRRAEVGHRQFPDHGPEEDAAEDDRPYDDLQAIERHAAQVVGHRSE